MSNIINELPKGTILGWYGTALPSKEWQICDGTNGTPDLIFKFPRGSDFKGRAHFGGKDKEDLTFKTGAVSDATHEYGISDGGSNPPAAMGTDHYHSASITIDTIPSYTQIVYIMKIS